MREPLSEMLVDAAQSRDDVKLQVSSSLWKRWLLELPCGPPSTAPR
jgi:hypothetical protein